MHLDWKEGPITVNKWLNDFAWLCSRMIQPVISFCTAECRWEAAAVCVCQNVSRNSQEKLHFWGILSKQRVSQWHHPARANVSVSWELWIVLFYPHRKTGIHWIIRLVFNTVIIDGTIFNCFWFVWVSNVTFCCPTGSKRIHKWRLK